MKLEQNVNAMNSSSQGDHLSIYIVGHIVR